MKPGEHYAIFYRYRDGWGQVAIVGPDDAQKAVDNGNRKIIAVDCVTNQKLEVSK